jgi:ABC-2 type transport system permease protein
MGKILYYELLKTFLKKRTYLGFFIVAILVTLVEVGMTLEGSRVVQGATRRLQEDFFFVGNLFNAWFVSYQIMNSLWVHVPLLISFVAGDLLAGEATAGTYRLILIRPVSRTTIFLAKFLTAVIYTGIFVSFLGTFSVGLAYLLLGGGDMLVLERGILILPAADVAWRFVLAYACAIWSMLTIASIALFFSSFVENAIGPIVGAMGFLIVSMILTVMPIELFDTIRPGLFTTHINLWQKAFHDPVPWEAMRESMLILGAYIAAAVCGAWIIFTRRDILS